MLSVIKYPGAIQIAQVEGGKIDKTKIYVVDKSYENKPETGSNKFILNDKKSVIKQVPIDKKNNREILYIAGPSGSGKSTYSSEFIKKYKKKHPNIDVYIFSRVGEDESIDGIDPIRIPINDELLETPIDILEEIGEGDLIIFDDCDTISDTNLRKAVNKIKSDVMETGRHRKICCIITSHLINGNDKKDMRTIFNEAHTITIFPNSGNKYGMKYALKNYLGIPTKKIDELLNTKSRYLTFSTTCPNYVISENQVEIL